MPRAYNFLVSDPPLTRSWAVPPGIAPVYVDGKDLTDILISMWSQRPTDVSMYDSETIRVNFSSLSQGMNVGGNYITGTSMTINHYADILGPFVEHELRKRSGSSYVIADWLMIETNVGARAVPSIPISPTPTPSIPISPTPTPSPETSPEKADMYITSTISQAEHHPSFLPPRYQTLITVADLLPYSYQNPATSYFTITGTDGLELQDASALSICSQTGNTLDCTIPNLGSQVRITLYFDIIKTGQHSIEMTISSDKFETNPADNNFVLSFYAESLDDANPISPPPTTTPSSPISSTTVTTPAPTPSTTGEVIITEGSNVPGCEDTQSCYTPVTFEVVKGTTVTWINEDSAAHTATSGDPLSGPDGVFDTKLIGLGDSASIIMNTVGSHDYFCMIHPWARGEIIVTQADLPLTRVTEPEVIDEPSRTEPEVIDEPSRTEPEPIEEFYEERDLEEGGTLSVELPKGQKVSVTLPPGIAATVSAEVTIAEIEIEEFEFIGDVVDLEATDSACADGCTISFTFTEADILQKGILLADVTIVHDMNENDFFEEDETISTTVTPEGSGIFTAETIASFTSKFAVGGIATRIPFVLAGEVADQVSQSPQGGGCLIATATYGSELAPQVQQLRELRDNSLLQTESGSAFMESFNQFYYSFSPVIADYERENPIFKQVVKVSITPLISSLSLLNYVEMDSEAEVLGYGISLILLNIGMYFLAPAFGFVYLKRHFN